MSEKTKTYGAVIKIRLNGVAPGVLGEAEIGNEGSDGEAGSDDAAVATDRNPEEIDIDYEYRSVYVEAGDDNKAIKKIRACIAIIYGVDPYHMKFVQYPATDYYPADNPLFLTRHALFDVSMIKSLPGDLADRAPWKEMGVSRRTWYRRFRGTA